MVRTRNMEDVRCSFHAVAQALCAAWRNCGVAPRRKPRLPEAPPPEAPPPEAPKAPRAPPPERRRKRLPGTPGPPPGYGRGRGGQNLAIYGRGRRGAGGRRSPLPL